MEIEEIERRAKLISDGYNGIISYHEVFYIHSIIYTSERCLDAFNRYEESLKHKISGDSVVSILQEAVGHAAAISRFFWPSSTGKKNEKELINMRKLRGEKLRKAFNLDESSDLYKRDIRNAFEHFDEKMDLYFLGDNYGAFYPECIIDSHELSDIPGQNIFKLIDPKAQCLILLGKKFNFSNIRTEVRNIHDLGKKLYENN